MNKELDIIELENGVKMPVIDAINYQNRIFIIAGVLNETNDDIKDSLYVCEKVDNQIIPIEDNELLEKLMQTFENRIINN